MGRITRTANSTSRRGFVKIAIAEVGAAYLAGNTSRAWVSEEKTATKRHMRKSSRRAGSSRPQAPIRNSSSSTATTTSTIQTASTSPAAQPSRPACQPRLGHACGRRAGGFRAQLCRRRAEPHGAGLCRLRTPTHLMGNETCKVWAEGAMTKTTGDERSAEGLLMEVLHATGDRRHDPRRLDRPFGNRAD